jgi:glycosyltransferase involved in cell wall biosynthesis
VNSFAEKPLVSIITVVFNGGSYLEETILSVINQTHKNIEYIIFDGGTAEYAEFYSQNNGIGVKMTRILVTIFLI